ncbi:MAG: FAD:protein FMN transferase [Deltaproteobacteria bacterium]|jgi:thiamine biosynthesis lipoprotein|nr:FAD:protein FMN transferase [Deltaproteobacteria bacterium]MBW2533237.1 FAD:protein FMN transferase [Deltaproteobacteria bacterium]
MIAATSFGYWKGSFRAMGSPCELLVDTADATVAREALELTLGEVGRIESKFSRYRDDSVVGELNRGEGAPVRVDAETAALLDIAAGLHDRSDGRFDITSGVLRRAWTFDGRAQEPQTRLISELRERIGWGKVTWERPWLKLPTGMEIDLGGLGKEYAADRVAGLLARQGWVALVNLGGDVVATGPRRSGAAWVVGVESTDPSGTPVRQALQLPAGALATSGDTHRYVLVDGERLGHILDPRTGWPLRDAPRSVTVRAETCTTAGALAQLAMLSGEHAERFLTEQGVEHWCVR